MLAVHTVVSGRWKQNCHVIAEPSGTAVVIDPGGDAPAVVELLQRLELRPLAILNTHGHYDHVGAAAVLREHFGIPFHLHSGDARLLRYANLYRVMFDGEHTVPVPVVDADLAGVEELQIGAFSVGVLAAPGHTPGSVVLRLDGLAFAGDLALFRRIGRGDLPGGDEEELRRSFRALRALPPETVVHPGHGAPFRVDELEPDDFERGTHAGASEVAS